MTKANVYCCFPSLARERGRQKCFVSIDLFEKLGASLGQCVSLCLQDKTYVCKIWPRNYRQPYITFDDSVYFVNGTNQSSSCFVDEKGLRMAGEQCIELSNALGQIQTLRVKIILSSCIRVKCYRNHPSALNDAIKNCLKFMVVRKGCTIEAGRLFLGRQYGIEYIVVDDMLLKQDKIICGKVYQKSVINVVSLESVERFTQRSKFKNIQIGGLKHAEQTLKEMIRIPAEQKAALKSIGVTCSRSVLLRGPAGCGKTSLVKAVSSQCDAYVLCIDGPELTGPRPGETEGNLKGMFQKAMLLSEEGPCVLFLDGIDFFCGKQNKDNSQHQRVSAQLLQLFDQVHDEELENLVIVAATNKLDELDAAFRRPGRLDTEIFIGVPTLDDRRDILHTLSSGLSLDPAVDLRELAEATPGYVGADLMLLLQQAYYTAQDRCTTGNVVISSGDLSEALHNIRPTSQKGSDVFVEHCPVSWREIGGLETVKQQIKQAIELPIKHPEAFQRLGLPPPSGVLLYGPPGCAKTTLVRAAATACHVTFLSVSCAQVYSPLVGDSEKKITEIFKRARAGAPCILFLDEIDSLVGSRSQRSGQGSSVQERVLSTLLNEMDGIGLKVDMLQAAVRDKVKVAAGDTGSPQGDVFSEVPVNNTSVLVVAATNRPDMLDDAILRPGRIDKIVYVPPPDQSARLEILKINSSKMSVSDCVDLEGIAEMTENFTGADLENLCREAALLALSVDGLQVKAVKQTHFDGALQTLEPSLTPIQIKQYQSVKFTK